VLAAPRLRIAPCEFTYVIHAAIVPDHTPSDIIPKPTSPAFSGNSTTRPHLIHHPLSMIKTGFKSPQGKSNVVPSTSNRQRIQRPPQHRPKHPRRQSPLLPERKKAWTHGCPVRDRRRRPR